MLEIDRIDKYIGYPCVNRRQRIVSKIAKLNYVRIGEEIIDGKTKFKEVIVQGWNYFRRAIMSYDKDGKRIEGSKFVEVVKGKEARNKKIPRFGVWA